MPRGYLLLKGDNNKLKYSTGLVPYGLIQGRIFLKVLVKIKIFYLFFSFKDDIFLIKDMADHWY